MSDAQKFPNLPNTLVVARFQASACV